MSKNLWAGLKFYKVIALFLIVCVRAHTHKNAVPMETRGIRFPGAGVTGSYEPLNMDAGNQAGLPCKGSVLFPIEPPL